MKPKIVTLDVREEICSGRPPFTTIQKALEAISRGEILRLLAPFEPVPLFTVAAKKGIRHESKQMAEGGWEVLFSRGSAAPAETGLDARPNPCEYGRNETTPEEIIEVDARGLEPPQPMVRILEALARLSGGAQLRARTDRRPVHLYSHLEERGFAGESEEQSDGSFITHIRHH